MLTAILGVTGALIFGSADFLGGLASKRVSPLVATAVAALTGLVLLLVALPVIGGEFSSGAVLWGGLSGVSGAVAISLLYACLAIGPMSILSPLTAVVSAVVPLAVALIGGERLGSLGYWALGIALVAVVLVGFVPEKGAVRPSLRGILMAIGSGAAIGIFLVLIDLSPDDSGLAPLVMNRAVNGSIMLVTLGVLWVVGRRPRGGQETGGGGADAGASGADAGASVADVGGEADGGTVVVAVADRRAVVRAGIRFAIACGVVDAVANTLLLFGIRVGDLSVMSVLTALYPAGTILLAAIVLRERIAPVQWVGLVLALTAAGMLAVA
ncbi:EamA/RhaT family transporter [Glaciibacter flavus]|uniref:EamA/RhaT family transporter n=1 Tax=Orlajensenia flava TaxID=2565934 RepID=A0A4S4FUG2_9MICO|nr:EamA family transporter [Glaciibacter flavus]THG34489.1 EamA/RhaT family transporter [Glaciibacter flavus]